MMCRRSHVTFVPSQTFVLYFTLAFAISVTSTKLGAFHSKADDWL